MAKNHIQPGQTMTFENTSGAEIPSGTPLAIGKMVGVVLTNIPDGEAGEVATEEVWELPKTNVAIEQGADVYLTTGGNITNSASGNTPAGKAFVAAASGDATINVKLNA